MRKLYLVLFFINFYLLIYPNFSIAISDGERCNKYTEGHSTECDSRYCNYVGNELFCYNERSNCPKPWSWGARYGEKFWYDGKRYECRSPGKSVRIGSGGESRCSIPNRTLNNCAGLMGHVDWGCSKKCGKGYRAVCKHPICSPTYYQPSSCECKPK